VGTDNQYLLYFMLKLATKGFIIRFSIVTHCVKILTLKAINKYVLDDFGVADQEKVRPRGLLADQSLENTESFESFSQLRS
jgi:hypothetical protein